MPAERAARVVGGAPGSDAAKGGKIYSDYLREVTPAGETAWTWHVYDPEIVREACHQARLHPCVPYARSNLA